jgi:hypothetical protein
VFRHWLEELSKTKTKSQVNWSYDQHDISKTRSSNFGGNVNTGERGEKITDFGKLKRRHGRRGGGGDVTEK